ncbi:hypothetical protein ACFVZE_17380 [Streptomyces anulatus]|uniref:hypothetical protein n=1 Tax=Streptomyces TaxID=1883 RepID=UPI001BDC8792|nr:MULTISPECIES: hypothetical protein [Streptomyces]MBT1105492.1 hypothetical protein [Streptomyces sp. Tu10]WUC88409.1 hypothetical protein OHQ35_20930 [Streptomyces anulatus]WUD90572.1 hypothetical protein OG703_21455 [Streptomyces anulatus]
MHASRRRATLRLLTFAALGALALTGCGGTTEGPSATSSPVPATATATAPAAEKPFAGTKRFVTTDRAWTEGGLTKLSVRSAEKKVNTRFDTWEIVPGTGEFVTVTLAKDARVLLTVPIRGDDTPGTSGGEPLPASQAEFITLLTQLDPRTREGAGFDLSFDGEGRVTKVQSLYKP